LATLSLLGTGSLSADWSLSGGQWTLDVPLSGPSANASSSGFAALEVAPGDNADNAEITSTGSWTFDLTDPYAIAFGEAGTLLLDGALDVTTDFDEPKFSASAVLFNNESNLQGTADIDIAKQSDLSAAPLVLGGVVGNGTIDLSGYEGSITVSNDNRVGSPLVNPEAESLPFPIIGEFGLDLSQSAVAVGLATIQPNSFFGIGTFTGVVDQTVTATAFSRDAVWGNEDFGSEYYDVPAITAAIGVGALGSFEDGIGAGAALSGAASSGSSTVETSLNEDTAFALTAALGLGAAGSAEQIGGEAESVLLQGTATSGSANAASYNDGDAYANSIALSAGFLGDAGTVENAEISADSSASSGQAEAFVFAESASAALAVGLGGSIGELDGSTVSAEANSADTEAFSDDAYALAASLSGSSALAGTFDRISDSSLNATSTSSLSEAFGYEAASALSSTLSAGLIGEFVEIENVSVESSATASDSTAEAGYAALASSNAAAFGVGDFRIVERVLSNLSGLLDGGFLGGIPSDLLLGDLLLSDSLEGFEAESASFNGDLTVTAQAGNADAFVGFGEMVQLPEDAIQSEEGFWGEGAYAYADASALAVGIEGSEGGLITGDFVINATAGEASAEAFYGSATAFAYAESSVIEGEVGGAVSGQYAVTAMGGSAFAQSIYSEPREALADADSAGIFGSIGGAYSGEMDVLAIGGTAVVFETIDFFYEFQILNGFSNEFADASATATGIGSGFGPAFSDTIGGRIYVTATGGTAASLNDGIPTTPTDAVEGTPPPMEVSEGLRITEGALNAHAQAVAVNGDVNSASVSAEIVATATGGDVVIQEDESPNTPVEGLPIGPYAQSSALAAGIAGREVIIEAFSGSIIATATPGTVGYASGGIPERDAIESDGPMDFILPSIPEPSDLFPSATFAAGIMAYEPGLNDSNYLDGIESATQESSSRLDVIIGSKIYAFIEALDLEYPVPADSIEGGQSKVFNQYAAALYGATGDDYVKLAEGADIIGDINLGGGSNTLVVTGDSIMEGNILSTGLEFVDQLLSINSGMGTVDFDIESGLFTAVRTVGISDLDEVLNIGPDGGIAPVLSQLSDDRDTSLLDVNFGENGNSADVTFAAGSRVVPIFANGVNLNTVVGNEYVIVDAEGSISDLGAVVDNSLTPFEYTTEVIDTIPTDAIEGLELDPIGPQGTQYLLTVAGVKDLDGEETPGTVQTNQAVTNAANMVMVDISKRAALLRSMLQRGALAKSGDAPTGAAGPDPDHLLRGEWLSYVSAFGNIGSQDSSNGVAGFDYDTYGFVFGQEKLFGDQLILGLAGSYARTDIDGDGKSAGGDSDLYSGTIYANWFTETWYVEGGFTYGHAENDVSRVDVFQDVYTGDYDSDLFGTWIEAGYQMQRGDYGLEPYARLSYVHGEHDGFTDSGLGGNPLTTQDHETDNLTSELGLQINREWLQDGGSSYFLELTGAWEHEWADEKVSVDANYLGDTLSIDSPEADRDALLLGLRGEWRNGEGLALSFEYQPTISSNWYNHAFSGTLQYNW
jgi:uncharacterized protein with beta-barrel porin domain